MVAPMSMLIRQLARYVAKKAASDPELREKAKKVAGTVAQEARQISRQDNRAYAAGKAFRRALDKWNSEN